MHVAQRMDFLASLSEWFALLSMRDGGTVAQVAFENYRDTFALAIHDYLILAAFGEARHQTKSAGRISNWVREGDRYASYE